MKDSPDAKEKTSRRNFAKSVASALVAVPVASSLSSAAQPPGATGRTSSNADSRPHPSAIVVGDYMRTGNPPVIIDGGSLEVSSPATLKKFDDDESSPKSFKNKYKERNSTTPLGLIKGIRIIDDYGAALLERELLNGETLKVYLWIQKVTSEQGDDDDDNDVIAYGAIANPTIPDIIIQGGALQIRLDKDISKDKKLFKRQARNPKRRQLNDWSGGHSPFRVGQVKVFVNNVEVPPTLPIDPDMGIRIILAFA